MKNLHWLLKDPMKQKEAWKHLLRVYLDARNADRIPEGSMASTGLCKAINTLEGAELIDLKVRRKMFDRLYRYRPADARKYWYWWPAGVLKPRIQLLRKILRDYPGFPKGSKR